MFRPVLIASFGVLAANGASLVGAASAADDPGVVLRLIGDAPTIGENGPQRFVINARVTKSDNGGKGEVKGWFAALPPQPQSGEVEGSCDRKHCDLSVDLESHKLKLSGDMMGLSGRAEGRFETFDNDPALPLAPNGAVSFTPLGDTVPGLGELVKPDAVDSLALYDLLLWTGSNPPFGEDDAHPVDEWGWERVADWQRSNDRPLTTGLLFTADLELLKSQRAAAQKVAGWTVLGSPAQGWSAGYPAALLPKASRSGAEQRFASADGKASLVIAIDPPLSNEQFDALVDKLIDNPPPSRTSNGYTRTGPDMQVNYTEGGQVVSQVYYNRQGGLARLVFTYPDGQQPYADIDPIVSYSLRVTDALKAAP